MYAAALGARPPRRVPEFLARLVLGKPLTAWLTTLRGASNGAAATGLRWRPVHVSWRQGFDRDLRAAQPA